MKSENNWIIMFSSLTEATAPLHGQNSQKAPFHPTLRCFQLTKNTSVKNCFCFKTFISPIVLSCCFIKMLYSESGARHKRSTCGDDVFFFSAGPRTPALRQNIQSPRNGIKLLHPIQALGDKQDLAVTYIYPIWW